jgi:glycosyltransferase involved in cell wall biosynthesis
VKILIVSWHFPPVNTIGSLRVGKLARFLAERGHDLSVIAASHWGHPETLPLGFPLERVVYAKWANVNALPSYLWRGLRRIGGGRQPRTSIRPAAGENTAVTARPSGGRSIRRRASDFYLHLTNLPDFSIGWLPWAYGAARRLCRTWKPELVFASGPPFTAMLVSRLIGAKLGVPWVAELRDRWADDVYDDFPPWRRALGQWLERRTLASAAALVTVTEPWAEFYRGKYGKPVSAIYNGYDPADFSEPAPTQAPPDPHLIIGYAGGIYPGKRDPTPLFEALRTLGEVGDRFRVVFCGTDPAQVLPLAERAGVARLVEVRPSVPYTQSIAFQRQADVLLLMQWNDPREQGNCPGKFFEYLGSLRPVLVLGLENGVPATIVRQRSAGICANEPRLIAAQLRQWLREKDEFGRVPALPPSAREGLSRDIQFAKLEAFLLATTRGR